MKMRRSLLNMGHGIVSYGKMVKIKAKLLYEGPCAIVKCRLKAWDTTDHQGSEVRVKAFGADGLGQWRRESKATIDRL